MSQKEIEQRIESELNKFGSLAVLFDKDPYTLISWGSAESIEKRYKHDRKRYIEAGYRDLADTLSIIVGITDLEELVKIVTHAGYIERFHKKFF